MITKAGLKYYSSLLSQKQRSREKKFLVEGEKLILEAISSEYECEIVFVLKQFADENSNLIKQIDQKKIRTVFLKSAELKKLCDTKMPQGIVAAFHFDKQKRKNFENEKLIVALENISDPGNLGTILRNCDWFGVKDVFLSTDCVEIYNPKVIRASAGSSFHLNISEKENLYDALEAEKKNGYKILCADLEGENIYSLKHFEKAVIVLSNEANGPTEALKLLSDISITIPKKGKAESLNVASASAVILAELTK